MSASGVPETAAGGPVVKDSCRCQAGSQTTGIQEGRQSGGQGSWQVRRLGFRVGSLLGRWTGKHAARWRGSEAGGQAAIWLVGKAGHGARQLVGKPVREHN